MTILSSILEALHITDPAPEPREPVDISAHLDALAAKADQPLDWRHSVVDLMKLLGMESASGERRELATELNYPGDTSDNSALNRWLHTEIMRRVRDNGGRVPDELL